jgi:hypothetical protein
MEPVCDSFSAKNALKVLEASVCQHEWREAELTRLRAEVEPLKAELAEAQRDDSNAHFDTSSLRRKVEAQAGIAPRVREYLARRKALLAACQPLDEKAHLVIFARMNELEQLEAVLAHPDCQAVRRQELALPAVPLKCRCEYGASGAHEVGCPSSLGGTDRG